MDGNTGIARTRYEDDTVAWAREQAAALRARDFGAVDWTNVIEEIDDVGGSQRRSLQSALQVIMEHLIKLDHGKQRDPERGWRVTVETQRVHADRILEDNPSLRRELPELIEKEYRRARRTAMAGFAAYEPERLAEYEKAISQDRTYDINAILDENIS